MMLLKAETLEIYVIVLTVLLLALVVFLIVLILKNRKDKKSKDLVEIKKENIEALANYVKAQHDIEEENKKIKELRKMELKQKLEVYKQTKDSLLDTLKDQFEKKDFIPLEKILNSSDKGGAGIYILYNENKDKYYVGQAKQINKRIKDHFAIEDIAKDYLNNDVIKVKYLTLNELNDDYRLDHIEKAAIEAFNADKSGYNKTKGNVN